MQEQTKIEETFDSVKDYVNIRYELAVLKASDKLAHIGSNTISFVPIIFLSILTVIMLSFGLALIVSFSILSINS